MLKKLLFISLYFCPFIAFAQKQTIVIYHFSNDPAEKAVAYDLFGPLQYNSNDFGAPAVYNRKICRVLSKTIAAI
jgi:hypothetical protein